MELVAEYTKIIEDKIAAAKPPALQIVTGWDEFHASDARTISVFAGRRTGKSYNIALRALRSENNCLILTSAPELIVQHFRGFRAVSNGLPRNTIVTSDQISFSDGRNIRIMRINAPTSYRGLRVDNRDVFIDEYDNPQFGRLMLSQASYETLFHNASRIICVGGVMNALDSIGKRWFNQSESKFFLDSPAMPEEVSGRRRWEYFPSEQRQMIEHLPPVDFGF